MDGSATFTMLKSSTTMNDAVRIRASASPRRPAGSAAAGRAVTAIGRFGRFGGLASRRAADFGRPGCDVLAP